jgi:hypothetical protein
MELASTELADIELSAIELSATTKEQQWVACMTRSQ